MNFKKQRYRDWYLAFPILFCKGRQWEAKVWVLRAEGAFARAPVRPHCCYGVTQAGAAAPALPLLETHCVQLAPSGAAGRAINSHSIFQQSGLSGQTLNCHSISCKQQRQRWISNIHTEYGFQTSIFTSTLWLLHSDGDKRHSFLSKVRLQLSSGSLKWTLPSQEFTAKSPHHLLLSEVAREPNLWTLASPVPTEGTAKELRQLFETSRAEWHKHQAAQTTNTQPEMWPATTTTETIEQLLFHRGWGEETDNLQGFVQETLANLKMQQWTRAAALEPPQDKLQALTTSNC